MPTSLVLYRIKYLHRFCSFADSFPTSQAPCFYVINLYSCSMVKWLRCSYKLSHELIHTDSDHYKRNGVCLNTWLDPNPNLKLCFLGQYSYIFLWNKICIFIYKEFNICDFHQIMCEVYTLEVVLCVNRFLFPATNAAYGSVLNLDRQWKPPPGIRWGRERVFQLNPCSREIDI